MCNVCIAESALATTKCDDETCVAFETGHPVAWSTGPAIKSIHRTGTRASGTRRTRTLSLPTVFVRARGRNAEGRAEFQVRRPSDGWPKDWQKTDDLAGAIAMYGMDMKWGQHVPKPVQAWVTYETNVMPTLDALHTLRAERAERRAARRPATPRRRHRILRPRKRG